MKKTILLGSILSILLISSIAFISPIQAQTAIPVSTKVGFNPCAFLLAQIIATGTAFLIALGLTVPVGGTAAWLLLAASGALGADAYALWLTYKELCGGASSSPVTGPISASSPLASIPVSGPVSSAPLCNCNAKSI